jgi:hypothetical protein
VRERRVRFGPKGERGAQTSRTPRCTRPGEGAASGCALGARTPRAGAGRRAARRPGALERERVAAGLLLVRTDAI